MKPFKFKNKRLLLSVLLIIAVIGGVYGYSVWQLSHLNDGYRLQDSPGNLVCSFYAGRDNSMHRVSGNVVYFDLGSRHSFINRSSAERLHKQGSRVKYSPTLLWTTDADGRYRLFTQKVVIDVSLPNPEMPDSNLMVYGVELLVVDDDTPNTFGMDLLHGLVVERLWPENIVNIYKEVPSDYHLVSKIDLHDSPFGNYVGSTGRASIKLTVNDDEPRDYYFDTGGNMVNVELVQPEGQMHMATTKIELDSVTGLNMQRQCRVAFGDRLRYSNVVYCDTLHTDEFSVNPLRLFDQDFILDFPGRRLMIHKTRE